MLGITYRWGLLGFMDISDWTNPRKDLLWILFSILYCMDAIVFATSILFVVVHELEVDFSLVWLIESWLILNQTIFTRTYKPNVSGCWSGRGIFKNASTSPMAGIYSGMKALSFVSSSWRLGVYLDWGSYTFE